MGEGEDPSGGEPLAPEAPTQPTRVVERRRDLTVPVLDEETGDVATEIDVLKGAELTPTADLVAAPASTLEGGPASSPGRSPILGLARPRPGASGAFRARALRLPTPGEIRAAVEGTPTEALAVPGAGPRSGEPGDGEDE